MAESENHPFLHGLSKHRGSPPTVVVIFGASGDLTARKLIPAIYNLSYDGLLPADFYLIGFGRKPIPDAEFQKMAAEAIKEFSRRELKEDVWARLAARTRTTVPVGLNLGANRTSPDRAADFARVLATCGPYVDFATVNVKR